jgi:hypothetical protein
MSALPLLLSLLGTPLPAQGAEVVLSPLVVQGAALFLSDEITAGGAGGGVGIQALYRERYLLQMDVSLLWGLGNSFATRLAVGAQHATGHWTPAAWVSFGALWGDRMEFLTGAGERPAAPAVSLGLRLSPVRIATDGISVSALEPGVGTDFTGGIWLELGVLQIATRL